jgi:hypothetical protein
MAQFSQLNIRKVNFKSYILTFFAIFSVLFFYIKINILNNNKKIGNIYLPKFVKFLKKNKII